MKAVIYLRVSTDHQANDGGGLDVQTDACQAKAAELGAEVVATYVDAGLSGKLVLEDRPGLLDAVGAVVDGAADVLIVAAVDRIARDVLVLEVVLRQVWGAGGQVVSCRPGEDAVLDPDDDSEPTRRLIRLILAALSEWERAQVRLRMRAGRRRKLAAGGWGGGIAPFGWYALAGELVEVEHEQHTLGRMARLRADGATFQAIADDLNALGYGSRTGLPWTHSAVRRALASAVRLESGAPQ